MANPYLKAIIDNKVHEEDEEMQSTVSHALDLEDNERQLSPFSAPRRSGRATEKSWDVINARRQAVEVMKSAGHNLGRGAFAIM